MITLIVAGLAALILVAVVVGILDRAGAVRRRITAGQRRDEWELRRRGGATPTSAGGDRR